MKRFSSHSSALVERIKVNQVWREVRNDQAFWFKRRRNLVWPVLAGTNFFFRLAVAPLKTLPDPEEWQRWEVDSFLGLHGAEGFHAFLEDDRTIATQEVPGINVTIPLDDGTLTPEIAAAVGRELRRAHQWECPHLREQWSHGDPHAGNFIYEPDTGRARIIDFEVVHNPNITASKRHADDVLVFLQDMMGRIQADQWLPCAHAFLEGYDRPDVVANSLTQLRPPKEMASRLWWRVRTSFLPASEVNRRLQALFSMTAAPSHCDRIPSF